MKTAINRFLQFLIFPLWLLMAFTQLLNVGVYCATYWLRFLLLPTNTEKKFSHPKIYLTRIFEATEKFNYPNAKN